MDKLSQLAIDTAKASPCKKRKVGAVISDLDNEVLAVGHNFHTSNKPCEDANGVTDPAVIHAEHAAITRYLNSEPDLAKFTKIHVTHQPCEACLIRIKSAEINKVIVVDAFMKFDTDKLRYDLVPPSAFRALAEILTYGAKKYKPNNWRYVEDYDRYTAALYRHLEAWRAGEECDEESGKPHLWHALCNVAFLIELTGDKANDD